MSARRKRRNQFEKAIATRQPVEYVGTEESGPVWITERLVNLMSAALRSVGADDGPDAVKKEIATHCLNIWQSGGFEFQDMAQGEMILPTFAIHLASLPNMPDDSGCKCYADSYPWYPYF